MRSSIRSLVVSTLALAALALGTNTASAAGKKHGEDGDYPLEYAHRPMTLPRFGLAPELDFSVTRAYGQLDPGTMIVGMNLGASFGITKDLEVGAYVLPLQFTPSFGYGSYAVTTGNLQLNATYRFFHTHDIELGARLRAFILTNSVAGTVLNPAVPLLLHLGRIVRLDAEAGALIRVTGSTTGGGVTVKGGAAAGLSVPASIAINVIDPLWVGANTGVIVDDLGHPKETARIPLGIFAGYAIGGNRPIVDLVPYFQFTNFIQPGAGAGRASMAGKTLEPGLFTTGLNVRAYIFL